MRNRLAILMLALGTFGSNATGQNFFSAQGAVERRAMEALPRLRSMSVDAMRQAFFNVGAKCNDITYFSRPGDWKPQITPNPSALYVYFNYSLKDGPIVLDFPAAGAAFFGSIFDAWQVPLAGVGPEGEDRGKGGKYLLLPPDFNGEAPSGYLAVRATYNGHAAFLAISIKRSDDDNARPLAFVKKLRLYPLSQAGSLPPQRHIDITGTFFNGIANIDGPVDVFFGPKAPSGKESNWIYTTPGKRWVTAFRLYDAEKAIYEKTWTIGAIETALGPLSH